jgi:mannose-6-phosphate isomerase-like protein (cupin superfamily)
MHIFELSEVDRQRAEEGKRYFEFLRVPPLSLGIYTLAAGAADPQQPHAEDEAYYVVSGFARVLVGDEDRDVQPGTIVFVPRGVPHRFHDISTDLTVLVIFAPAESPVEPE